MQNTSNYGFKKPDRLIDTYKIQDQNDNWDIADSVIANDSWKQPCRAATTANITLSGTQTVDGIAVVVGDRVLVKNQTTASQNGIYVVASGAWSRATDTDISSEVKSGMAVKVSEGTVNTLSEWFLSNANPITLGTTTLTFTQADGIMTLTDTTSATASASRPNILMSMLAFMIKSITGKANWYATPATTLEATSTHMSATTGVHGATNAPTASTLVIRDSASRAQFADPSAAQDAATKAYVDSKTVPAATTSALGTVQAAAIPASGNPITPIRTAIANDVQVTSTSAQTVATFTPTVKGNFFIPIYFRVVTGTTNVTITVTYADGSGVQTTTMISAQSTVVGSYSLVPLFINAVSGTAINVTVTASVANQVYASASIMGV